MARLPEPSQLAVAGAAANQAAAGGVFAAFQARKALQTRRRQQADLRLFGQYLAAAGIIAGALYHEPETWRGTTWGLVAGFVQWQLQQGYAIGSINVRLATVKVYCQLALHAGVLDPDAYVRIKAVAGDSHMEGRTLDQSRPSTRVGRKKVVAVTISGAQARQLKRQPLDTPQGRRDSLLMCLLLDHGLRCSEIAGLRMEDLNLTDGTLRFYRPKVGLIQTHALTNDSLRAAVAYLLQDAPKAGSLLPGSRKNRALSAAKTQGGKRNVIVRHVGRRSGKPYAPPIIMRRDLDGFIIEQIYGRDVEWYTNRVAAGGCTVLWHQRAFVVDGIEPVATAVGRGAFAALQLLVARPLGRTHFEQLRVQR